MPKFKIIRVYKHTEELEVEAENRSAAQDMALEEDFERNNDDWLYSEEVIEM